MTVRWIGLALGLVLMSSVVAAYVPPPSYLLQRFVQARIARKIFSLQVVLDDKKLVHGSWSLGTETLWLSAPFKMRSEWEDDTGQTLRIRDGRREWRQSPGSKGHQVKRQPDLIADFFACAEDGKEDSGEARDRLMKYFDRFGIDTSKTSLTRFDGRIAILIGAEPWNQNVPQLWLDKDELFPLRFIYREEAKDKGPLIDLRLMGYGGPKAGTIFPELIERYRDGVLVQRSSLRELKVAPKLNSSTFRIP